MKSRLASPLAALCLFSLALPTAAQDRGSGTYAIPLPPKPNFAALEWLVGQWTGNTTGRGNQGEVRFSVAHDLDKQFLIFREDFWLPPTKRVPSASEAWVGILSQDRKATGFILRMFSNTGFISRYRVVVDGKRVRFSPEGGEEPPPGWLFRRTIVRNGADEITVTVEVAPPGQAFFEYFTAKLTKRSSSAP